jgi:hypothetical protein
MTATEFFREVAGILERTIPNNGRLYSNSDRITDEEFDRISDQILMLCEKEKQHGLRTNSLGSNAGTSPC